MLLVLLAGSAAPAAAHETASTVTPVIDGFVPAVAGVEAFVQSSQDATLLTLEPAPGVVVEVLDDRGGAWAGVTSEGVEADLSSPAFHAATNPNGAVPATLPTPDGAWTTVSRDGRFQWFEHRLHPPGLEVSAEVLASDEPQDLTTWEVPLRVDGRDTRLEGRLRHVPVTGSVVARLTGDRDVAPGVTIDVVPGPVPAFVLQNQSDAVVTVLSRDGSPYAVLDDAGVAVNLASPTWGEQRRFERAGGTDGAASTEVPAEAVFERISATATHSWLDSRAALPGVLPDAEVRAGGQEVVVRRWTIPLQVDGELVVVEGESVWVPLAASGSPAGARLPPPEVVVAVAVALVLAGVWVRRRRAG